jgi:hypothetical protein
MVGIIGNGALTSMELSLEEHGDVVQGSFSSDTIGTFIWVMEVIDPYLDHPPPTSMYKEKPF